MLKKLFIYGISLFFFSNLFGQKHPIYHSVNVWSGIGLNEGIRQSDNEVKHFSALTFGASYDLHTNDHLSFEVGLEYWRDRFSFRPISTTGILLEKIYTRKEFLTLPLGIRYSFLKGSFHPYLRSAISPTLLLNTQQITTLIRLDAGAGVEVKLAKGVGLFFETQLNATSTIELNYGNDNLFGGFIKLGGFFTFQK
jgi:hypothetical protein